MNTKHDLEYRRANGFFEKKDWVVPLWGVEKRAFQIELKPKTKHSALHISINIDGVRRECLAQWWRHATDAEIKAGRRIEPFESYKENHHV